MDSLQEIEIVTTGASAEFAFAQGAVFNVVTKQGGDTWRFDFSYYNQNEALTAASEKTRCRCPDGESGFMNNAYHDATTHLGGDLVPNRLWLFAGYQYRNHDRTFAGMDPRFPLRTPESRFSQKLNWQVSPRVSVTQTFQLQAAETGQPPTATLPAEALVVFESGQRARSHSPELHSEREHDLRLFHLAITRMGGRRPEKWTLDVVPVRPGDQHVDRRLDLLQRVGVVSRSCQRQSDALRRGFSESRSRVQVRSGALARLGRGLGRHTGRCQLLRLRGDAIHGVLQRHFCHRLAGDGLWCFCRRRRSGR